MVNLRSDLLPSQIRGSETGLKREELSHNKLRTKRWIEIDRFGFSSSHYQPQRKTNILLGIFREKKTLTTSISVFEWPILQTMQPFFILSMWSLVTTCLFPAKKKKAITPCELNCRSYHCQWNKIKRPFSLGFVVTGDSWKGLAF